MFISTFPLSYKNLGSPLAEANEGASLQNRALAQFKNLTLKPIHQPLYGTR
jgi:hypothetical protein